jgi:hypothetical protein
MKQQQTGAIDHAAIGQLAYELWEMAGQPHGRDQEFWFKAEIQLKQKQSQTTQEKASQPVVIKPASAATTEMRRPAPLPPPQPAARPQRPAQPALSR